MIRRPKIGLFFISACFLMFFLGVNAVDAAQAVSDQDLIEKCGKILGDYEMRIGEQARILKVYVENGSLWAAPEGGRAISLEPIEDGPFEFQGEDEVTGTIKLKFLPDDAGDFNECLVTIVDMDMEMRGTRVIK